jgi:hypothetical protein
MTMPANSRKRILHPQDRAALLPAPGEVAIPRFETLREMAERYSAQRLGSRVRDENLDGRRPVTLLHDQGQRRRRERVLATSHWSWVMTTVHISVIYCHSAAMRIFSRGRVST